MANLNVSVTTKCEECGAPADENFSFGGKLHYFCPKHEEVVLGKVTQKPVKPAPTDAKK